jgi:hypothetical protein
MRLIIAGSRGFTDFDLLEQESLRFIKAHRRDKEPIEIISGCATGADKLGERFADKYGLRVHLKPANWSEYGKSAGMIRNQEMANIATHALLFWDGESRGTEGMAKIAKRAKLTLEIVDI